MAKKDPVLIVDGKEYTITEDKKFVQGRNKKRTIDEFRGKKGEIIPILVVNPNEDNAVYGFSNEETYKEWLIENKRDKNYEREQKMLEKARRGPSPAERERIKKDVKEATEKYREFLKESNLKINEIEKIKKLRANPYSSGRLHSVCLYDRRFQDPNGAFIVLPGGNDPGCGAFYPNLADYGFNNITSSFQIYCSEKAKFFDDINMRGVRILEVTKGEYDLSNWWFWFGFWNNRFSSVIVY